MVEKSLKIGLAVLIQYRRITDSQPATLPEHIPRLLCHAGKNGEKFYGNLLNN